MQLLSSSVTSNDYLMHIVGVPEAEPSSGCEVNLVGLNGW